MERPFDKEREARICSCYKFALKLLIAKSHESNPTKVALWTRFLAQLVMQPKHRIICVRMAIKSNLEVQNYGVASRFINILLPLNLVRYFKCLYLEIKMDKALQETQFAVCKQHNFEDFSLIPYTCPVCNNSTSVGNEKCQSCGTNIILCNHVRSICA